jgi:hypothetical protein
LAFLALVFLVGILILAYMIAAKSAGALTVIYVRRTEPTMVRRPPRPCASAPPLAESPGSNIEARLATVERLRSTRVISEHKYSVRSGEILREI